jgi:hypothetical protein
LRFAKHGRYNSIVADDKKTLVKLGGPLLRSIDSRTGLSGRTFERKQGCWNCFHFDYDRARDKWFDRRQADLAIAVRMALESPLGENDPKVVNIRRMVEAVDLGIKSHTLGTCDGTGIDAEGNSVGDFVKSVYLCAKWSGAQGASVARAGEAADPLPMELRDKEDN